MLTVKALITKAIDYFLKLAENRYCSTYLLGASWQMNPRAVFQVDYLTVPLFIE